MSLMGAALMSVVIIVMFFAGIYEKKLRKDELETHKIAAYLHFKDGYVKQIFADDFYLGSGKNSDVRIPLASKEVAPVHANIWREGQFFHIKNLAPDKTIKVKYLGKEHLIHHGEKNVLHDGSIIVIGKHTMTFKRGVN